MGSIDLMPDFNKLIESVKIGLVKKMSVIGLKGI